jgi:hypothetical protein
VVEKPQGASGAVGQMLGAHDQMPSLVHFAAHRTAPDSSELPSGAPVTDVVQYASEQPQSCWQAVVRFLSENPHGAGGAVGLGIAELEDVGLTVGLVDVQLLGRVGQIPTVEQSCAHCVAFNELAEHATSSAASGWLHCDRQYVVQLGVSELEKPQGAAGGVSGGHAAGSWAVTLTRLHAVSHVVATVMLAVAQKARHGCVKVLFSPHGAATAGGGEHGAGGWGVIRSLVQ